MSIHTYIALFVLFGISSQQSPQLSYPQQFWQQNPALQQYLQQPFQPQQDAQQYLPPGLVQPQYQPPPSPLLPPPSQYQYPQQPPQQYYQSFPQPFPQQLPQQPQYPLEGNQQFFQQPLPEQNLLPLQQYPQQSSQAFQQQYAPNYIQQQQGQYAQQDPLLYQTYSQQQSQSSPQGFIQQNPTIEQQAYNPQQQRPQQSPPQRLQQQFPIQFPFPPLPTFNGMWQDGLMVPPLDIISIQAQLFNLKALGGNTLSKPVFDFLKSLSAADVQELLRVSNEMRNQNFPYPENMKELINVIHAKLPLVSPRLDPLIKNIQSGIDQLHPDSKAYVDKIAKRVFSLRAMDSAHRENELLDIRMTLPTMFDTAPPGVQNDLRAHVPDFVQVITSAGYRQYARAAIAPLSMSNVKLGKVKPMPGFDFYFH